MDSFSKLHPSINFIFFFIAILGAMFFMQPILLGISFISSLGYTWYLRGGKAMRKTLKIGIPFALFFIMLNPIFNHQGMTIWWYLGNNPITKEAVFYGIAAATMLATVILWFMCYNEVMSSDKFIYLFGKLIPTLSLILSMVLRLIPKMKHQLQVISHARRGMNMGEGKGIKKQMLSSFKNIQVLLGWSLEDSMETAASMKARGYGLKNRTSFSIYRLEQRDIYLCMYMAVCLLVIISATLLGKATMQYFPRIILSKWNWVTGGLYGGYALFLNFPLMYSYGEEVKWNYLQSKI